jgi:hypothetical protein
MKFALLLFLLSFGISAQTVTSPSQPDLTILKKQWYKEFNSPAFEKSPFAGAEEMQQLNRNRRAVRIVNQRRSQRGLPPLRTPTSAPQTEQGNTDSPDIYTYKLKVKNNGNKQIKLLIWDYVFYEPGTTNEVGRIQFEYAINIGTGKTKDLAISTEIAPSKTINVKATGKKLRDQYSDQIVIQSIEYSDGSIWNNAEGARNQTNNN